MKVKVKQFEETPLESQVHLELVEPMGNFCGQLRAKFPALRVTQAAAGELRECLGEASADAICVATAFHWFATREVLEDLSATLKEGGVLFLIWNRVVYDLSTERGHFGDLEDRDSAGKDISFGPGDEEFLKLLKRDVVNLYHDEKGQVQHCSYKGMKGDILKLVNDVGTLAARM